MHVFVTGGSGWIGSAVIPELLGAGHQVTGLARSNESATRIESFGADVLRGDVGDPDVLRVGANDSDGIIHLAYIHDFSKIEHAVKVDGDAIEAFGVALEGTDKPLVIASGTPSVPGRVVNEHDDVPWGGPMAGRRANALAALDFAARGVRACVVRVPRSVHGEGDHHGLVARLIGIDRELGASGYVDDGSSRWPAVHVLDAAALFRLALESAPAGSVLHAVADEGVAIRDIATAIGRRLGLPVESRPAEDFGFLGMILGVDQPASSVLTRELLGWRTDHIGLIDDLDRGHYFT